MSDTKLHIYQEWTGTCVFSRSHNRHVETVETHDYKKHAIKVPLLIAHQSSVLTAELTSGCSFRAAFLYADLISLTEAFRGTSSTS
jgi:hypothetical protein